MKFNLILILIISLLGCKNEDAEASCCTLVIPKTTVNLPINDIHFKEVNFLISISHALERYKLDNYEYPTFDKMAHTNDQMFGRKISPDPRLFIAIAPYCDSICKTYLDAPGFREKIAYLSNGAQYKMLIFDNKLCVKLQQNMPSMINPEHNKECFAFGLWTFRATYW